MKLAIGADHRGYALKAALAADLRAAGHSVLDAGTDGAAPVDYPDYAKKVGEAIVSGSARRGIVVCGSGIGACVAANKIPGIRAALCHDSYSARQGVEDDDINVLCLGAGVIGQDLAKEVVHDWIKARFSNAARHKRRLEKIRALEKTSHGR